MKSFKQYYRENKVTKSTDLEDVAGDNYSDSPGLPTLSNKDDKFWSKYINALGGWLNGDGNSFLLKHKDRVPTKYRKGGTFYRGFSFYDYGFKALLKILKSGKLMPEKGTKMSSWTTELSSAIEFSEQNQIGIVVAAKIASKDIVLDVAKWALDPAIVKLGAAATDDWFTGMGYVYGENEVLVAASRGGLPVNPKTVKFFHMPSDEYDENELSIEIMIKVLEKEIAAGRGG